MSNMASYNVSYVYCKEMVKSVYRPDGANAVIPMYVTHFMYSSFLKYCSIVFQSEKEAIYNRPVVWVGVFILIASLVSCLIMLLDLWSGFYYKQYWFPCRYFYLGAVSLTLVTAAVKLSTDMTSPMNGKVDITSKFGTLAFMCTMITNIMPSLASKDTKELLSIVISFAILIITVIGNTWVQCISGVIPNFGYLYVGCFLLQLILLLAFAVTVSSSNKILKAKYQTLSKTVLKDQAPHDTIYSIKSLSSHVERYLIMAETRNPEFALASNPICFFSLLISLVSLGFYIIIIAVTQLGLPDDSVQNSVYSWSTFPILIAQFSGTIIGVIAPIIRCFTVVRYKGWKLMLDVFRVERYWTHTLIEWKENPITFRLRSRRFRRFIRKLKSTCLRLLIGFHKGVVVTSKMLQIFPIMVSSVFMYHFKKMVPFTPSSTNIDTDEDMSIYGLYLDENMQLEETSMKRISDSLGSLIRIGKKEQPNNLIKLLENSVGFEGVEKFNLYEVEPLLAAELPHGWSLAVASLTCIAVALPSIDSDITDNLFESVGEGLYYTHLVEEGFCNASSELVNAQSAARKLWDELDDSCIWLEKTAHQGKTAMEILQWFSNTAQQTLEGEPVEDLPWEFIVMNSMYRISQSIIMLTTIEEEAAITEEQLFTLLSRMIADILLACYTNIPQLIIMKCHKSAQENRKAKAGVEDVAKLLGEMTKIISILENHDLPSMDPHKRPFIDQWRLHL